MSVTGHEQTGLEGLVAARLRGAGPEEILDLADTAIEQASAAGDGLTLELIAAELDSVAATQPESADGLEVAAARARASSPSAAPSPPATPSSAAAIDTHAPWGSRCAAWLIDWVTVLVLGSIFTYLLNDSAGIVLLVFVFAYFAYYNGRGSTLGKRLLRIKVVDATTHEPIGTPRGALRELVRLVLTVATIGVALILDGLRPLWNEKHQSWHDTAARSIVVRR